MTMYIHTPTDLTHWFLLCHSKNIPQQSVTLRLQLSKQSLRNPAQNGGHRHLTLAAAGTTECCDERMSAKRTLERQWKHLGLFGVKVSLYIYVTANTNRC